jgi:formylglycine-generating enzyme required for sulfatase activity
MMGITYRCSKAHYRLRLFPFLPVYGFGSRSDARRATGNAQNHAAQSITLKKIKKMRGNSMISLCALLLVGATGMMTAGAQGSGNKPTLAVFVVGMDNTLGDALATQIGNELNRNSRYTVLSSATNPVLAKLTELRAQGSGNIDRNALAEWGRTNGVSTICLVTDAIKGNDHMFYAHLIDTKDNKVSGRGNYIHTGVATSDITRIALALSKQLEVPERVARKDVTPQRLWFEPEMVFMPSGTFEMGHKPSRDGDTYDKVERPLHNVTLSSFSIGKYLITQEQWKAVVGSSPSYNKTDDQMPVECVSWQDIETVFLPQLNTLTGKNYRLPTEAEWEYAARGCKGDGSGGVATCENFIYSGSNNFDEVGWYKLNGNNSPYAVGQKKPNALGIYDMSGNVWEWCSDIFSITYYDISPSTNPMNTTVDVNFGTSRACRGGGFPDAINSQRVANRSHNTVNTRFGHVGFRVVLPAQ